MNLIRILVVDDEPNLSDLVRLFLEKTGRFEVRTENRPAQALQVALEFRPDMVLLDVDMPGSDGGEVARHLAGQPTLRGTPILFLTSLISRAEAGASEVVRGGKRFLAKPVNPKVLIEVIDRILAAGAKVP
jgi:CheY-like chemotaxis protein